MTQQTNKIKTRIYMSRVVHALLSSNTNVTYMYLQSRLATQKRHVHALTVGDTNILELHVLSEDTDKVLVHTYAAVR